MFAPRAALTVPLLLAAVVGQEPRSEPSRIHWYLGERMADADPSALLPVYVVMQDRLGADHWFPRVRALDIEQRRATVMAELRAHAEACQRDLVDQLEEAADTGEVDRVLCNWLGNFVQCRATPKTIRAIAARNDVDGVRFDVAWPLEEVEDVATVRPLAPGAVWGYGPVHMRAVGVWELGFDGTGVVVMNADSGIHPEYPSLVNRMWVNPGEIPGNGIDDDGNGFVDDIHGWNFFDNNNDISDDPVSAHGTSTAGSIAADATCFPVSQVTLGQAPGVSLITGKLGKGPGQSGPINPASEVAQWNAVQYAILMGADIQTSAHSYKNGFIPPPNYRMHREIGDNSLAAGLIRLNSTSNNGTVCNSSTNPVRRPFNMAAPGNLPPPYLDPNQTLVGGLGGVIGVGSHDIDDNSLDPNSPCGPTSWSLPELLQVLPTYPAANWSPQHNDYPWSGGAQQGLLKPDVTGPVNVVGIISVNGSVCQVGINGGTSTATPRVAGCLALWKQANPSLGPEDIAMVVHQSAVSSGSVPGKENDWGAGRVDALNGLHLALCVHRVEDQPAWAVDAQVGGPVTWEVDTVPSSLTVIALGTQRAVGPGGVTYGGVLGLGGQIAVALVGDSGPSGETAFTLPVLSPALVGLSIFSQCFTDDAAGVTKRVLSSNVIETRFVP